MARAAGRSDAPVKATKATEPHRIKLVDQTRAVSNDGAEDDASTTEPETDDLSRRRSRGARLSKKLTHGSMKDELARRKYAKWKRPSDDGSDGNGQVRGVLRQSTENTLSTRNTVESQRRRSIGQGSSQAEDANVSTVRTASSKGTGTILTDAATIPERHDSRSSNPPTSAIDVLYENQRGYFFFGVPFFSGNSLLNFDPPAWVTANGGPSPVDIQTAQVPDPSWEWAWPCWYVDMANDVDEEGWQYSFAFFKGLAWHGTHPWFHSFVRRRRWLRKRVRTREMRRQQQQQQRQQDKQDDMRRQGTAGTAESGDDHDMTKNTDSKGHDGKSVLHIGKLASGGEGAGGPRGGKGDNNAGNRSLVDASGLDGDNGFEDDDDDAEIRDIHTLSQRLRYAAVDRERIGAVKSFLRSGADSEITHLSEHINYIMSLLVFDTSRRQLLHLLRREQKRASSNRQNSSTTKASKSPNREQGDETLPSPRSEQEFTSTAAIPRPDSFQKAITAASSYIQYMEYWSDVRGKKGNNNNKNDEENWAGNEGSMSMSTSMSQSASGYYSSDPETGASAGPGPANLRKGLNDIKSTFASASASASAATSAGSSAYGTAPGWPMNGSAAASSAGVGTANASTVDDASGNKTRGRRARDGTVANGGVREGGEVWKDVEDCADQGHHHGE